MEIPLIPLMFYGIVSIVYLAVAAIGFLVGYFAFRVYKLTSEKSVQKLSIGFFILSFGFLVLTATSLYTYLKIEFYQSFSGIVPFNYYGFGIYYSTSIIAYILLALTYVSEKKRRRIIPILFVPLWYANFTHFHLLSLLLIGFVVFKSLKNSFKRKEMNSYLVTFAFVSLAMFHVLLLLTTFTPFMYVVANSFLIVGFIALLTVLIRVNRR